MKGVAALVFLFATTVCASDELEVFGDMDVGSGDVPLPPSPPFQAPLSIIIHVTGDVSDYTKSTIKASLKSKFATKADVSSSQVNILVTSGSVRIEVTITSTSLDEAMNVQNALKSVTDSASDATDFLKDTPGLPSGFSVEDITMLPIQAPPSAPSSSPDGLTGGQVAGIVIGCLLGAGLIGGVVYYFKSQSDGKGLNAYQSSQ